MRVYAIGDGVAPPKGAPDPDLLVWIEEHDCILITNNRATMPVHLAAHLARGHHVPGILQLSERFGIDEIAGDLVLIWGAALPGEFRDRIEYLPVR